MGILGIQHINPDAQSKWEKTGNEPRRPHLQKITAPTPVPSLHRCLQALGLPEGRRSSGTSLSWQRPGACGDESPHKYVQLLQFKPS